MTVQASQKQIDDTKKLIKDGAASLVDHPYLDSPYTVRMYRHIAALANIVADMIQFNLDHAPESTTPSHQ